MWMPSCWYCSLLFCATVERQDSLDSVEYHSQLEDNKEDGEVEEDEEEEEEMAMPTANKKGCKKKLHFGIFRKSKSKDRMKNKVSPTEGLMHTLSVPGEASHSSSLRQTLSESEGSVEHWKTQSYQEFAETLMNPTPRASLLGAESRVGCNFCLRLLWEERSFSHTAWGNLRLVQSSSSVIIIQVHYKNLRLIV